MIKKEKGVTLVALVITIIVMIILASITITASTNLSKETELKNLQTSMLLIQAKAQEIYNQKEKGDISEFPGVEVTENDILEALGGAEDKDYIRHLESGDSYAKGLGLEVESDDFYVNYKTGEVYSAKGFEGKHTLSELKNY